MAIYHLSVKTISRSAGRSATAAAAYRAGVEITDERTGELHDYTRKGGVDSAAVILPENAPEWARDRARLWNAAEQAETRKNSTVAREFEIALPAELSPADREKLAHDFARELVKRHGFAADVAIHAPGREGDNRNHHAHILLSTRRLLSDGFGEKTRELDDHKTGKVLVTEWRERFATMQNERLRDAGHSVQVDHRSLEAQGIDRAPTQHLGQAASGYERRTGQPSDKRIQHERATVEALGELERQSRKSDRLIFDLEDDLEAAKRERTPEVALARMLEQLEPLSAEYARLKQIRTLPRSTVEAAHAAAPTAREKADHAARQLVKIKEELFSIKIWQFVRKKEILRDITIFENAAERLKKEYEKLAEDAKSPVFEKVKKAMVDLEKKSAPMVAEVTRLREQIKAQKKETEFKKIEESLSKIKTSDLLKNAENATPSKKIKNQKEKSTDFIPRIR